MKKVFFILAVLFLVSSCRDAGTTLKGFSGDGRDFKYLVMNGDTIDFVYYFPSSNSGLWVAKSRSNPNSTMSLSYSEGKTHTSVIIVETGKKKEDIRKINGDILSETDSIIVIKKK